MADIIETVNGSLIQHGHHSDRIYLMRLNPENIPGTLAAVDELAAARGYGKIFARIPSDAWPEFKIAGYRKEAVIPYLYRGKTDGFFVARYLSDRRRVLANPEAVEYLVTKGTRQKAVVKTGDTRKALPVVLCSPVDTPEMGSVFGRVFESYPFPIYDPDYLKRSMEKNVRYYSVQEKGNIAALAAAEIDPENQAAEMTDFATLPRWRNTGMASALLSHMESQMRKHGIKTAYTIARAASRGINRLFESNGYRYAGLLINNTQISGSIQSMAVWYKPL